MKRINRQNRSGEQEAAVAEELEMQITEILQQTARLNQEARAKLKLAGKLVERLSWHYDQEADLPF